MKLVNFKIEHFDRMDIEPTSHLRREYRERYEMYAQNGSAFTLLDKEGNILACGGVVVHWAGVGEVWILKSKSLSEHPVSAFRVGRFGIADALERLNLHRIQATVEAGDVLAQNYIEAFDFVLEGKLRCYGPEKQDYFLYARVK